MRVDLVWVSPDAGPRFTRTYVHSSTFGFVSRCQYTMTVAAYVDSCCAQA